MSQSAPSSGPTDLAVGKSRVGLILGLVLTVALLVVATWFVTHPEPLPTSERTLQAETPVGVPIYVAVYAGTTTDRTITVSHVHVNASEDSTAEVTAQICVDGSLSVTADATGFCTTVAPATDVSVGPGDVLMLRLESQTAGHVELDDLQVSYRDGLQWGTQPVGPRVRVTFLER